MYCVLTSKCAGLTDLWLLYNHYCEHIQMFKQLLYKHFILCCTACLLSVSVTGHFIFPFTEETEEVLTNQSSNHVIIFHSIVLFTIKRSLFLYWLKSKTLYWGSTQAPSPFPISLVKPSQSNWKHIAAAIRRWCIQIATWARGDVVPYYCLFTGCLALRYSVRLSTASARTVNVPSYRSRWLY